MATGDTREGTGDGERDPRQQIAIFDALRRAHDPLETTRLRFLESLPGDVLTAHALCNNDIVLEDVQILAHEMNDCQPNGESLFYMAVGNCIALLDPDRARPFLDAADTAALEAEGQ